MMYRTLIKRDGFNPLTGKAQYRVIECYLKIFEVVAIPNIHVDRCFDIKKVLGIVVNRFYKKGAYINPRKALGI